MTREEITSQRGKKPLPRKKRTKDLCSKTPNLFVNPQVLSEDSRTSDKGSVQGALAASVYPEPMAGKGAEERDTLLNLSAQERIRHAVKRPVTGTKLRRDKSKEQKPKSVLNMIPADVNDAKTYLKDAENQRKYLPSPNSSVKSRGTHRTRRSTHYLKHLPQIREIPSNFEGSGSPDFQVRGDNDIPPFSGDGQHFMRTPSKGDAVGPGRESSASHVGLSGSGKAEIVNPHRSRPGSNEIPETEVHSSGATRDKTAQGAGATGVSLVGGSNEITGSTNFRELPGKEGNRIDAGGSQNAHQGKVEFHYPRVPSKEKVKGGGGDSAGSASHNEIPKSGRGSSRKDGEEPKRNQIETHRYPGPPPSLGKEVKSEEDPSNAPHSERVITANSRANHYVLHGQNNSGMSQWRGSGPSRRRHYHRRFSQGDSSESSSDSSSESEGD